MSLAGLRNWVVVMDNCSCDGVDSGVMPRGVSYSLIDICGGGGIFLVAQSKYSKYYAAQKIFRIFLNRQLAGSCQTLTLTPNRWFPGFVW